MPAIPNRLRPGDAIALIAPASAPPDPKTVDLCAGALVELGFKVKLGRHVRKRWGFVAGQDAERADDLMRAFADRKLNGIFCLRGGYGTSRLLTLLDYSVIRNNPKVFLGFSDITSLQCAFLKRSNLVTFHGPMAASHFITKDCPAFTMDNFWKTLSRPEPPGSICEGYDGGTVTVLRRGKVSGVLLGGNISLLSALVGTPFQPSFRRKILFFEDVDEKPYRMDRLLTHLLNAGLMQQVAGVAVGLCHQCVDDRAKTAGEYRQTLEDVLKERLLPLKIPVVIGLPFGHVPCNATLPVGATATLDAQKGDLIITSRVVR